MKFCLVIDYCFSRGGPTRTDNSSACKENLRLILSIQHCLLQAYNVPPLYM